MLMLYILPIYDWIWLAPCQATLEAPPVRASLRHPLRSTCSVDQRGPKIEKLKCSWMFMDVHPPKNIVRIMYMDAKKAHPTKPEQY